MFPVRASFVRQTTVDQLLRAARIKPASHAAPSLSPCAHGFAYIRSGLSKRAESTAHQRVLIPESATPQSKCLLCTVLTPDPAQVQQAEVIKSLPSLLYPLHRSLRNLTFFITPEFAKWVEEGSGFIEKALEHVHHDWSATMKNLSSIGLAKDYQHVLQSRVVVVDRLPFPEGNSSGCPGISLAVTTWAGKWLSASRMARMSAEADQKTKVPQICVKLNLLNMHGELKNLRVLLRPANTLFVNGLQSTMFVDRWGFNNEAGSGPKFVRQGAREHVQRVTVNHLFQNPSLTVPLQRLTRTREISMSMGNVISKLVGTGDSKPTSASLELEEKVSAFMKNKSTTNGTLAVFALILPKQRHQTEPIEAPDVPPEIFGYPKSAASDSATSEKQEILDSIRLAISKGAHLHKVTSGGGGWGKKQGLLSLEPAMDIGGEELGGTSVQDFENFEGRLGESGHCWGKDTPETARPGDMVEFYGTFWSKDEEKALVRKESLKTALKMPDTKLWDARTWANKDVANIVLGVIPPQDSNSAITISTLGDKLVTVPHHFGMLSENGMGFQRVDDKARRDSTASDMRISNITRIDVPHTVLRYSVPNRIASRIDPVARVDAAKTESAETGLAGTQNPVFRRVKFDSTQPPQPRPYRAKRLGVSKQDLRRRIKYSAPKITDITHETSGS